ncbi:Nucleoporin like [Quillaja saponaria]|uniref:Nucleoporin like n=1 Tax=Quillaja saponaria TaxID=32244 RepID=A0AAD7QC59_QUISA|nr:Nucleoporin like [Quillaja saponaria]
MADTRSVDASLWWDSFTLLLTELENAPLSSDLPQNLEKKLNDNRAWFVDTVSLFKPANEKSRGALNSQKLQIGSHQLTVQPELKDKALQISSYLCLDEVQSYILAERSLEHHNVAVDSMVLDFLHAVLVQYYMERQCLLKCTRHILMHALYVGIGSPEGYIIREEARKLFHDGLETKLISLLQDLLSSSYPEQMDIDLFTLWAEETIIEDNLVLDILFLAYYDSFCTCNGERWKKLCSLYKGILSGDYNLEKLAITADSLQFSYHAKTKVLLILIETLDLENLLQMVRDEMPFSKDVSTFSLTDVQEMDSLVSTFNAFQMKEAGPLILTWAVFLCLISSLPGRDKSNVLMEIDHIGYIRQAFEAESLSYCRDILKCDILKESDGPVAGYRSVLRTLVSAFIASYEINFQLEDNNHNLVLDMLCEIYRGEEALCTQFWDKESFVDGPIRCLLSNLGSEFPFRIISLVRFLSSLCEGAWPAECAYNFLDKSVGVSTLFEITSDSLVDEVSHIVETHQPLQVPGVEGLVVPARTRGQILKVIGENAALVQWQFAESGVFILLVRLAQEMYLNSNEEVLCILDLLSRLVSFNTAVCFALMEISNSLHFQAAALNGNMEKNIWVVEIICTFVRNLSPNSTNAGLMSLGVNILGKMLTCSPSNVSAVALKANIFDIASQTSIFSVLSDVSSSGSWLFSGKLAKMLLVDCEQNNNDCPLAVAVLDFTMRLVATRVENDAVLALIAFSLQYVLVNHGYWKYKVKHIRWRITLKVLEVMKECIISMSSYGKLGEAIHDVLFGDSSIHSTLFLICCTTTQALEKLYVSRLFELVEIEGLQRAIASGLDIIFIMLSKYPKDSSSSLSVFHQSVLSCTTKPVPVVTAVISLISYFRDPAIQVGAGRVISMLFTVAGYQEQYLFGNTCFALDDKQIMNLRCSVRYILLEQSARHEDLVAAMVNLLTSAARFQPAFLVAIFSSEENVDVQLSITGDMTHPKDEASFGPFFSKKSNLVHAVLYYVERADDLIRSNPHILLRVLHFMNALWQGAAEYASLLESLKRSRNFWKQLSNAISLTASSKAPSLDNLSEKETLHFAYSYKCQSAILRIMAYDLFLKKKLLPAESVVKDAAQSKDKLDHAPGSEKSRATFVYDLKDMLSSWCKDSVLENLMKSYASGEYDNRIFYHAKVAVSLFSVHVMERLATGDSGSLSASLVQKIHVMSKKLRNHPAFSELLAHYSQRGYSEGKELDKLILSDIYYHLKGELESRKIGPGPFKELCQYLVESNFLGTYGQRNNDEIPGDAKDVYSFDLVQMRADLGIDMWDCSEWKASKEIAETMLQCVQDANLVMLLARSKLSALKSLITVLAVYNSDSLGKNTAGGKIPDQLVFTCIDHICQCFLATVESLAPFLDASEDILDFLAAQTELLLQLTRSVRESLSLAVSVLVLKSVASGLKVLTDFGQSVSGITVTIKLLLTLLLSVLESNCLGSYLDNATNKKSFEDLAKVSNETVSLLPILCNCIDAAGYGVLSLTAVDLILRDFLTPNTWFRIIQDLVPLQHVILKLHDKSSLASIQTTMKFFLTLARVKGGAEMLFNSGFLSSLKVLFAEYGSRPFSRVNDERVSNLHEETEKPQSIWGLGLAVVTAMVQSLADSSYCIDIVDNMIQYLFSEKSYLISYYLNAPDFPSDDHDKKRPRTQKSQTSFTTLKDTENTLMLMCELAKHWNSWVKAMKEMDTQLREKCIHLLAFISRGAHHLGESSSRNTPLLCPPTLKEEFDDYGKPSFIDSKNGWFAISQFGCVSKLSSPATSTALIINGQATKSSDSIPKTYFSDRIAEQIYRISFLLLKFLCLQAEGAAKRAEEVGFVDLAHFPELPMPEILHGLQDQAIAIVTELCEANKTKIPPETQNVCLLLLEVLEMALHLELCVLQICGIRPVLGRVEDFSKEIKSLFNASGGHVFLKASMKSLKQIISVVHPGLLQEGFL